MGTSFFLPLMFFGTLLAALWFGVMGVKGVKRDKARGTVSALAVHGDEQSQQSNPRVESDS
jgi:hypothetical protein